MVKHDPECPCLPCDNRRKAWAASFERQRADLEQAERERRPRSASWPVCTSPTKPDRR